ncbi:MAG: threonylcarbamoyl-AMP synthase [Deltaproteobacteria bacterium]|nr:threonylcarbamoyl-AMP synthase [Deltaproteobacteria bacterium]MBW2180661.1 threonylcarbamoyl-AMP synthase [Deltaproteobacteria bacterium]
MTERILKIDPEKPQKDFIDEAARTIKNGGVIAFPTRSLYGLGADALNPDAVQKIFEIKKRPLDKPILVLIKDKDSISDIAKNIPPLAIRLMDTFWPGNVTIVLKANPDLPSALTAGTGKIGVRLPQHPVASALVKAFERPLTGTSANISGVQGCSRVSDLDFEVKTKLDLILDAGTLKKGQGSTVVDVTTNPSKVLREGEILEKDIQDFISLS